MTACIPPVLIETERLVLRPVTHADTADIFHGYSSTEEGTRYVGYARHTDLAQAKALVDHFVKAWCEARNFGWTMRLKNSGDFVGVVDIRMDAPKADFGFSLAREHWNQGFATEAARPVLEWAWSRPEIHRLWALCHPDNLGSGRALEKLGLQREALLPCWLPNPQLGLAAGPRVLYGRTKA